MSIANSLVLPDIAKKVEEISRQYFGDHSLDAISGGGKISQPNLALVFINPTHRNISTSKQWAGIKTPWIGCANIWQLFSDASLIDPEINNEIQRRKSAWSPQFAEEVYAHVAAKGLYITNIVKWAGLDAKLPDKQKISLYAPLLIKELEIVQPKLIVAFGQLTFDGILRELDTKSPDSFGKLNEAMVEGRKPTSINTSIGNVTPCYFPVGQGVKNRAKAIQILHQLV